MTTALTKLKRSQTIAENESSEWLEPIRKHYNECLHGCELHLRRMMKTPIGDTRKHIDGLSEVKPKLPKKTYAQWCCRNVAEFFPPHVSDVNWARVWNGIAFYMQADKSAYDVKNPVMWSTHFDDDDFLGVCAPVAITFFEEYIFQSRLR